MSKEAFWVYERTILSTGEEFTLTNNPIVDCPDLYDGVIKIYKNSISPSEQQSESELENYFSRGTHIFATLVKDGRVLTGCMFWLNIEARLALLSYMATSSKVRSHGYGSKLLSTATNLLFEKQFSEDILIEVDSVYESSAQALGIRHLRQHFYKKNGAKKIDGFNYICPIYSDEYKPEVELQVISNSNRHSIGAEELKRQLILVYTGAYDLEATDPRLEQMFARQRLQYKIQ